jgi:hypothetical protein
VRPAGKVWVQWNVFNLPAQGAVTIAATRTPLTIDAFDVKYGSQVLAKAQIAGKF